MGEASLISLPLPPAQQLIVAARWAPLIPVPVGSDVGFALENFSPAEPGPLAPGDPLFVALNQTGGGQLRHGNLFLRFTDEEDPELVFSDELMGSFTSK